MKDCNACGKCCTLYGGGGLSATDDELDFWEVFRPEIHRFVREGNIWSDPESGEVLLVCPWLEKVTGEEKYHCKIYFDRPEDCRHYPVTVEEMIRDDCEMLEPSDLIDLKRSQLLLDSLMASSRPPKH